MVGGTQIEPIKKILKYMSDFQLQDTWKYCTENKYIPRSRVNEGV